MRRLGIAGSSSTLPIRIPRTRIRPADDGMNTLPNGLWPDWRALPFRLSLSKLSRIARPTVPAKRKSAVSWDPGSPDSGDCAGASDPVQQCSQGFPPFGRSTCSEAPSSGLGYGPVFCLCYRSLGRQHPSSNSCMGCKTPCRAKSSRLWPRKSKAASPTGSWSKAWARPCVFASLSVSLGVVPCRPATRASRRSGCSGCATSSRRISTMISRSLPSPISPVSAPITSAAVSLFQRGGRGWAAALCHPTPARACKDLDAADPPAPRLDCTGGRFRRPEPSDLDLPTRDGHETRPVPRWDGLD